MEGYLFSWSRNVKILIATDSFKGSMSSAEAATAIARGLGRGLCECGLEAEFDVVATADGGEGTVDAFDNAAGGERVIVTPGGRKVSRQAISVVLPALPGRAAVRKDAPFAIA